MMEKQIDVYINGAYIGRASGSTCAAIRDIEAKRPHRVHGVVFEDSDPPRLVLNPVHDESPALVRRVVEAMVKDGPDIHSSERLGFTVVSVNGARVGHLFGADTYKLQEALVKLPYVSECSLCMSPPGQTDIEVETLVEYGKGYGADAIKKIIDEWFDKPADLKEATRAFEKAINAEPGIEAELQCCDASTLCETNRHRWQVRVTRNERTQVYP